MYVHVPFCARRCSYCDFAIAVRRRVPVDAYVDSLAREVDLRMPTPSHVAVESIYLGGGTPSLLGTDGLARVIDLVADRYPPASNAEITIEVNPDDVDRPSVSAWRSAPGRTRWSPPGASRGSVASNAARCVRQTRSRIPGSPIPEIRDGIPGKYSSTSARESPRASKP